MKNKYTAKQVKMATGIAKQKHDSMTDAVERIEKIAKGLSDHPGVSRALKRYNEETNMYYHEEFGYGEVLESTEETDTVLFPHGVEIIEKSCGSKKEDNTNDQSDDGEGLDKVQPKALKKKFKDRKDKDIDNDGDEDESDEYLHNRRKTISKKIDEKEDCPKCDGKGCGHCDNKGYHESLEENEEEISELKKSTYARYLGKAGKRVRSAASIAKDYESDEYAAMAKANKHHPNIKDVPDSKKDPEELKKATSNMKTFRDLKKTFKRKADNRVKGIARAGRLLAKEEVEQIDEAVARRDQARLIGAVGGWAYARANNDAAMARDHNAEFWVTLQKVAPEIGAKNKVKDLSKQPWANTDSISALKKGLSKFLGESVEDWETEMNENFTMDDISEQDAQVNQNIERARAFLTRMWENSAAGANAKRTANAVEAEPQLTVHDKNSVTGKSKKYHDDNTVDRKDDEERSHDDAVKASKAVKTQAASRNGTDNLR